MPRVKQRKRRVAEVVTELIDDKIVYDEDDGRFEIRLSPLGLSL